MAISKENHMLISNSDQTKTVKTIQTTSQYFTFPQFHLEKFQIKMFVYVISWNVNLRFKITLH